MLKLRPDADMLQVLRSIALGAAGDKRRAVTHAENAAAISEGDRLTLSQLSYAYAAAGETAKARRTFDIVMRGWQSYAPAYLAAPLLALGDEAGARRLIDRATAQHCPWRAFVWCDPRLKPMLSAG
jgi:Flp pilus assembly protein TadD